MNWPKVLADFLELLAGLLALQIGLLVEQEDPWAGLPSQLSDLLYSSSHSFWG